MVRSQIRLFGLHSQFRLFRNCAAKSGPSRVRSYIRLFRAAPNKVLWELRRHPHLLALLSLGLPPGLQIVRSIFLPSFLQDLRRISLAHWPRCVGI